MDIFAILFLLLGMACNVCGLVAASLVISIVGLVVVMLVHDTWYAVLYAVLGAVSLLWLL